MGKIRFVDSEGNIREDERPLIKPLLVNGEEGFGVYHSPIVVTSNGVYKPQDIKPRFFSEEVADQRDAAEIRRKQADEKVKQMFSGKEYAKLGGLTLAGAAAAGTGAAGLGYLSTLPGTVAGNFIGDAAGSMALGMGLEEGQRAAFGRSAGDIVYSQLKPYIGEFGANMARPEYIISPSMVLKNTYTQATNNLGRQFERETARLLKPINKKDRLALRRNTLAVAYAPEYKKLVESPTTTYLDVTNHLNRQQDKFLNLQKAISGVERALAKSQETSAKVKDIEELKVLARQYDDLQREILSDEKILNQYNTKTAGAIVDDPKFRAEIEVPNNSPRFQLPGFGKYSEPIEIYVSEHIPPISEEFIPTDAQLQREIRGLRSTLQEGIGNNGVITGSSVGVSEGWIPERPGDVEIITTENQIKPIRDYLKKLGFNINRTNAAGGEVYSGSGLFTIPTNEQKIELNTIKEVDGKAVGSVAHQIYAFLHPEEYSKFLSQNRFKVQNGMVVKQDTYETPLPISAQELFNEYNSNSVTQSIMPESDLSNSSLMNLFDILTVYNDKSGKRAVNVLMNPELVPVVDKLITRAGKKYFGNTYTPASSHYNISFQNIEQNKEFLKFLNGQRFTTFTDQQINKIANNPDQVRNIFNSWHQQNFIGIRKVSHNTPLNNTENLLFNRASSSGGGTQSGPGLNHTTGFNPLRQSITGVRPFYISYNPENIESFSDFINQYKRIYQNPLIDRDRQFYHDSLDGIPQASERIINLSKQMDIPIYKGNANKSYSFLGSLFPKQEGDLYAILNSRNPEFGSGLTYLYGKDLFPTNNFTLKPDHIYNNSSELAQSILKNFNIEGYLNSSGQVNWRKFTLDLQRAYPNSSVTFYTDKNNWRGHSDTYKKGLIRQLDTKYKQRKPLKRNYYKKKEELKRAGAFTREANNTENLTRVLRDLQVRANKLKSTVLSRDPVNKMSATISYRDPNYKTSNLFNRFFAQQKINGTEFDKYGTIANYSRGVPEHIKSYINQNTVERAAIAMRKAGYSEREIQQYIEKVNAEMDNVKYGMYSNKDYKDAGFGDFAGFYNDDNNFISVNKESPNFTPDEVFKHEVRHLVDHRTSMTDEMYNILDDAYDKDFLEIPKHENAGSLKDYPYMDREKVTTNLDARNALFKDKNLTWVLDKNSYAEHTKPRKPRTVAELFNPPKREYPEDMIKFQNLLIQYAKPEDIVKAVESSNGYGRRYIEYLRETGKLTPEKIEQFRKALMYVPGYVLPAAGGYKLLKSQQSQIKNNN